MGGAWRERLVPLSLLIARLYVGYWFLFTGITKISRGYLRGGALLPQLQRFLSGTPQEWYRPILESVIVPNEHLFAVLAALGETAAGLALLAGALVRYAAAGGIFMVGNYLFAKGWSNPAASHDKDFLVLLLVVLVAGAGRFWGLDGWLRSRRRT